MVIAQLGMSTTELRAVKVCACVCVCVCVCVCALMSVNWSMGRVRLGNDSYAFQSQRHWLNSFRGAME